MSEEMMERLRTLEKENSKATCYECGHLFRVWQLIEYVDGDFPDGVKLCEKCFPEEGSR